MNKSIEAMEKISFKRPSQELKRELILEEATRLFIQDGYENMKISELAKNAGVSVGTIYTMFGSKETLYNQYVISQIELYTEGMQEELKKYTHPIDMLKTITHLKFSAMIKNKNALKENIISDPTFFLNVASDDNDPMMYIYRYIAKNIMEPLSTLMPTDKEPLELVFLYDGITFGMIKYWIVTGGDLTSQVDEAVEHFLKIIHKPQPL